MTASGRPCRGCEAVIEPGEPLVRVEYGECTPYGLAPVAGAGDVDAADADDGDATVGVRYYHARCLPPAVADGTDVGTDR